MAVIGASPITFTSEDMAHGNHGKQYQIPLSELSIKTDGSVDTSGWHGYTGLADDDKTLLGHLLASMVSQGLLTKPPS
jgi:hypothetical protein